MQRDWASTRVNREAAEPGHADGAPRSFLFLQGPISSFFDRLGRTLIARGHRVQRINLHFGDQLFWRLPAANYRGRFEDWRAFVAAELERHQVTDLLLHGDRRPYHIVAAEEARARGIAVIATDLGYARPDWITLEYDGMTTYSRFPRDPAVIRTIAADMPEPELEPRFHTPFWLIAVLDVGYNLGLVFGRLFYPNYRYHSIVHPFLEYGGWLWSRAKRLFTVRAAAAEKRRLAATPGSYFLMPLQLSTDYQIRAHSPYRDLREAVHEVIASFAASGSLRTLVLVVHPLDNGLIGWTRLVGRLARQYGVPGRVQALPGGTPTELLCNAAGVVTVNSTIGVTALHHGVPVKVLGNAIFDVPGLTCQAPLTAFWHEQKRPDRALMDAFLRALIGTTQVKGSYYEATSQACAIAGFVERLEQGLYPLPPVSGRELDARSPGTHTRTVVLTGLSGELGLALARRHAAPGVRLSLIGSNARTLARAADDCRQRGAAVDTFRLADRSTATLADYLAALDGATPVDLLLLQTDPDAADCDAPGEGDAIGGPLAIVGTIVAAMRRRADGKIVLVSNLAGQPLTGEPYAAARSAAFLLGAASALRRQLREDGVSLAIVAPGGLALRLAGWLRAPELTTFVADRIAERTVRLLRRRRPLMAVPGVAGVAVRASRIVAMRLFASLREMLSPSGSIRAPVKEAPLPGDTGTGN